MILVLLVRYWIFEEVDEIKKYSPTHDLWIQNVSPNNTQATPVSLRVVAEEDKQIGNCALLTSYRIYIN